MRVEQIGNLTLVCADCMEVMRGLEEGSFDIAVCDPDYGIGKCLAGGNYMARYKGFVDNLGGKPGMDWFESLRRVSHNQVVWGGNYFDFLPPTRCFLVWHKKDGPKNFADCEYAWTSFDRNARVFSSARNPKGVSGKGKRIHVCQKPVQLYMWTYDLLLSEGGSVLDTHMGSGSSAIAAYETGHPYLGIEINEEYFERAVERIRKHVEAHPKTNPLFPYLQKTNDGEWQMQVKL